MKSDTEEQFGEDRVTYTLQIDARLVVIENVPAWVSLRTGERFFSPATVERMQAIAWGGLEPERVLAAPVFRFAA